MCSHHFYNDSYQESAFQIGLVYAAGQPFSLFRLFEGYLVDNLTVAHVRRMVDTLWTSLFMIQLHIFRNS